MILSGLLLILDRLIKVLALKGGLEIYKNKSLFFLNINQKWLVLGVGSLLIVLIIQFIKSWKNQDKYLSIGFLMIILGGLSNVFDRIVYGYVIDMINFFSFSVFNIADVMIIGGCVLICGKIMG
ncbi:MAG: signal peptidase II [Candidatus Beckwithbacteria bacterium]